MSNLYLILFFISFTVFCFYSICFVSKNLKSNPNGTAKNNKIKNKNLFLLILIFILIAIIFNIIFALIFLLIAVYIYMLLKNKKQKKTDLEINKQIVYAIRLFKNSLLSGQTLIQSIDIVSEQLKSPLSDEFKTISKSVSYGINLDDALLKSCQNIKNRQYKLFIDSIRISNVTGAKLSDILEKIEQSISQRISIYSKVETLTAQGKISGTVISTVPVFIVIFVCLAEPDIMGILWTTTFGNLILLAACIMILTGSFLMRKIAEPDL